MIDLDRLTAKILDRLDTDAMEIGSAHEMGRAHYKGIPSRVLRFKYSDILPESSLAEAIHDALREQGIDHE